MNKEKWTVISFYPDLPEGHDMYQSFDDYKEAVDYCEEQNRVGLISWIEDDVPEWDELVMDTISA